MKTFRALIEDNRKVFTELKVEDLIQLFLNKYDTDEVGELTYYDVVEALDYDGSLHHHIDAQIDIYYHALRLWAVDNYQYVEDAISEGLCDGTDYHASIQSGQYLYFQERTNEDLEELVSLINSEVEALEGLEELEA